MERHHATEMELWVGMHKVGSRLPSMTWPQAVDEALCFGWIDGVRQGIDEHSYMNRFTPRKPTSNWSEKNIMRFLELEREGLVHPAGRKAFEARREDRVYSYEQRHSARLDPARERRFRANQKAWAWFQGSAPSYRKAAIWWVVSGKREQTRDRRLAQLIQHSAAGRTVPPLTPRSRRG